MIKLYVQGQEIAVFAGTKIGMDICMTFLNGLNYATKFSHELGGGIWTTFFSQGDVYTRKELATIYTYGQ